MECYTLAAENKVEGTTRSPSQAWNEIPHRPGILIWDRVLGACMSTSCCTLIEQLIESQLPTPGTVLPDLFPLIARRPLLNESAHSFIHLFILYEFVTRSLRQNSDTMQFALSKVSD